MAFTAEQRKQRPLASGVLDYFPDALLEVALVSWTGNEQHNPGTPVHWDRSKSGDEADALMRHLLERGTRDTDGMRHSAKVAWRALALLQKEIEAEKLSEKLGQAAQDTLDLQYETFKNMCFTHPEAPNSTPDSTEPLSKDKMIDILYGSLASLAPTAEPANSETHTPSLAPTSESPEPDPSLLDSGCSLSHR